MHLTSRLLIHEYGKEECFLLNMLTGAVDVIDREGYEQFRRMREGDLSTTDPEFVNVLKKRGYLFQNEEEEDKLLKRMFKQSKEKLFAGPIKALICPTFACNLRCTYCFQGDLRERVPRNLKGEEITLIFRALEKIVRKKGAPGAQIELSGGEPLLSHNYELIGCILNLASKRNYPVGIVTNGVNLPQFRPLLKKYRDSIGNVQITIDGPAHIHNKRRKFVSGEGTFEKVVKGVDLVLALGIPTVLRVNVDLENVDFLPELAEFITGKEWNRKEYFRARLAKVEDHREIKNKDFHFLEYTLTERIEMLESSYPPIKDIFVDSRISRTLGQISKIMEKEYDNYKPNFYYCEATSAGLYVFGPDGLLYPCGEAAGNPSFSIGRFLPTLEIDEEKFSHWRDQSIVKIPECHDCPIVLLCGGGCRYEALRINDKSRKALCDARKKQVDKYIELHARKWLTKHEQVALAS